MAYTGPPLPPPTVMTALAIGVPPNEVTRAIPPKDRPFTETTYTVDLHDDGMFKRSTSASAVTVIIPKNADVPIPTDSMIHFAQGGAGQITFVPAAGVTLNIQGGVAVTQQQWAVAHLWQYDVDHWAVYGGIGAAAGGGGPGLPNRSVQFNRDGNFGGSVNWIFDPPRSGFTLGVDTQFYREAANTVSIRPTTTTAPADLNIYGRYDPASGSTDNYDRMRVGNWQYEGFDVYGDESPRFFMGVKLESEWDLDGYVALQPSGHGGIIACLFNWRGEKMEQRGRYSVDLQVASGNDYKVAGGHFSSLVGSGEHIIFPDCDYSGIFAGEQMYMDTYSLGLTVNAKYNAFVGGGFQFCAGKSNFMGGGYDHALEGDYCAQIGGEFNFIGEDSGFIDTPVRAIYSATLGGDSHTINADYVATLGGFYLYLDAPCAVAMGDNSTTRTVPNCFAQGAGMAQYGSAYPGNNWPGQMQTVSYVLQRRTTDATLTVLTTNGLAPVAGNSLVVRREAAYNFQANIVAKRFGATEGAGFLIRGLVARGAAVGTVALIGAPTITILGRTDPTWNVAVAVNAALGSLEFRVTGAAGTELWWSAQVRTAEASADKAVPPN